MTDGGFEVASVSQLAGGRLITMEEILLRSPGGEEVVREVVRHPGGVAVLAIDEGKVWLIRQHRVALGREMIEIPAGKLDAADADPAEAARRELEEELGATASSMQHLATMAPSPGYTDEVIEIYLAQGLAFGDRIPDGAEERHATVISLPVADALDSIDAGSITDAKTMVALLQWNRRKR